jgi:hypothetical protein
MATPDYSNLGIVQSFMTKNRTYTKPTRVTKKKLMLHSTASPGAPAKNFYSVWNSVTATCSVEFCVDDTTILQLMPLGNRGGTQFYKTWHCAGTGNSTHVSTELCEPIEAQLIPVNFISRPQSRNGTVKLTYATKRIQMELKYLGYYNGEVDGNFGEKTEAAVIAYQKAKGLTADGEVGKNTFYKMRERSGSYLNYDVESATPFFNKVYNKAVALYAYLCDYVGCTGSDIMCHCEGYTAGIASNHADVMHWFPLHGKSMDTFRSDVDLYRKGAYVPLTEETAATVSEFDQKYLNAVSTLQAKNVINSPTYWNDIVTTGIVNNEYVKALLRQCGSYFCGKSFVYGVDALSSVIDMTAGNRSLDLWKNGISFDTIDAEYLIMQMGILLTGNADITYANAVQALVDNGIINSPTYWLALVSSGSLNASYMQALIRQCGAYLCKQGYQTGVAAIKNAIGMNSVDYWLAGDYSALNVKYLFIAVAAAL